MAKSIEWTDAARAGVRRIDRETALRILAPGTESNGDAGIFR